MRILILGNASSVHIANFIDMVKASHKNAKITLFSENAETLYNVSEQLQARYNSACVNVHYGKSVHNFWGKIHPKLGQMWALLINCFYFGFGPHYDYCFVHYVGTVESVLAVWFRRKFTRLTLVFWGSDIMRSGQQMRALQQKAIDKADYAVCDTEHLLSACKKAYQLQNVSAKCIRLPYQNLYHLEELAPYNQSDFKTKLNLPQEKILVAIGYNRTQAQQHLKVLEALSKLPQEYSDRCVFVLPLTYGGTTEKYQAELENALKESKLETCTLRTYLSTEDVARLTDCMDVFINAQTTDALASAVTEHLYSGTIMLHGDWLTYEDLRNGYYTELFSSFEELSPKMIRIIDTLSTCKEKAKVNCEKIKTMYDYDGICAAWNALLEK